MDPCIIQLFGCRFPDLPIATPPGNVTKKNPDIYCEKEKTVPNYSCICYNRVVF